ncbi:MAG TPA: homoserine dehydrogenase [Luteibaculaceae bacterium]|nr:homoserine dehydrogenase [Luteibaculaceae bacterium]
MARKKLTLGLFGFGCVGGGLYDVLHQTPNLNAEIKKICVKHRHKPRKCSSELLVYNALEIIDDPEINVVVEMIDDADAAFELVSAALRRGKAVVSANKKMIAEHFSELHDLQKQFQAPFLYEASCCASIPIIRNLEEYYDNDLLSSIQGIVNGSTNYILTKVAEERKSYHEALLDAQQLGYAESNPILDVGGFDAKYKLLLLVIHAFGLVLKPEQILNVGIDRLNDLDLSYAREKGYQIKLVAQARRTEEGAVAACVLPALVDSNDPLFRVSDVYNGLKVTSAFSDQQFFVGKGAGAFPTASAVLSDISALSYDYRYEYRKLGQGVSLSAEDQIHINVYVRAQVDELPQIGQYFVDVIERYSNQLEGYLVGKVSLASLRILINRYDRLSVLAFNSSPLEVVKENQFEESSLASVLEG